MLEKTSRRGFLGAMLAAAAAPAIVKSGILMPVKQIIVPPLPGGYRFISESGLAVTMNGIGLHDGDIITMAGVYRPDGSLQPFRVNPVTRHTYQLEAWR